jgi:cobalamin biosynthesis protein CobD/CbiB
MRSKSLAAMQYQVKRPCAAKLDKELNMKPLRTSAILIAILTAAVLTAAAPTGHETTLEETGRKCRAKNRDFTSSEAHA